MPEVKWFKPRRWLTSLSVRNFRAFERQSVDLAPLTVFVGPNNAGKSSLVSAIRALAQTIQSPDWKCLWCWEILARSEMLRLGIRAPGISALAWGLRQGPTVPPLTLTLGTERNAAKSSCTTLPSGTVTARDCLKPFTQETPNGRSFEGSSNRASRVYHSLSCHASLRLSKRSKGSKQG